MAGFDLTGLDTNDPLAAPTLPLLQIEQLKRELLIGTPFTGFEYVDVTFGSANADFDIRTTLRPGDPETIDYLLMRSDRATSIYHDQSGTRRTWRRGYIVLRSSVASAAVTLLLLIRRTS